MNCQFDYCIYNKHLVCLLDKIEINTIGQCEECIVVSLPEDKLEKYKKEQLEEITKRL